LNARVYLFTSESVSEVIRQGLRPDSDESSIVLREGPKAGIDPWAIRAACETLATTNKVVIARRNPRSQIRHQRHIEGVLRRRSGTSATSRKAFTGTLRHRDPAASPIADIAQGVDALQPGTNKERRRRPGHHVRLCLQRDRPI